MHQLRRNAASIVVAAVVALFTVLIMQPSGLVRASQNALGLPTTGTFSGLTEQNSINNALDALLTCNSGSTAPTNALGGAPKEGQCWLDTTSATMKIKKRYTGSGWVVEGWLDVTNGIWIPAAGGGTGSVASAATTDLCADPHQYQAVSGTTGITSFGSSCVVGTRRTLIFSGAVTLTYNSVSMILPGQVSYTTAANDIVEAVYLGSGDWRVTAIDRINGQAVINPAVDVGSIIMTIAATVPSAKYVFGYGQAIARSSYPDYLAAVTRAQTATASVGSATLTSVGDTSGMGAGMPIEAACLSAGTTIASVTGNSITVNASGNVITNGPCTVTVFFTGYGVSGTSSTVGVPDCRGRAIAGRDDMGGTAASRLTSAYFGAGTQLNVGGGNQSHTLTVAEIPSHYHAANIYDPGHTHGVSGGIYGSGSISYNYYSGGSQGGPYAAISINSAYTGVRVNAGNGYDETGSTGGGGAHSIQNPTLIANCMVRVLAMNFPPANDNGLPIAGREPLAVDRRLA